MIYGFLISILLHFLAAFFFLSGFEFSKKPMNQENLLIVDFDMMLNEKTNINKQKPAKAKTEKTRKQEKKKEVINKNKKVKKTVKEQKQEIDDMLKSLDDVLQQDDVQEDSEKKNATDKEFNKRMPLSLALKDIIKSQIYHCWHSNIVGAKNVENVHVILDVSLDEDAKVINVKIANQNQYFGEKAEIFKIMANSAIRAVNKCSPLKGLPKEEYDAWKNFQFDFDLRELM